MRRLKTDAGIYGLRGSGKRCADGRRSDERKTGGQDGTLPEEVKEDMETAEVKTDGMDVADVDDTSDAGALGSENMDAENPTIQPEVDDPRDYTKKLSSSIILNLVLPGDKTVSDATISLVDAPSLRLIGFFSDYKEVDRDFDSMVPLLEGLTALGSWQDSLTDTGLQLAYIGQVFNSYREEKMIQQCLLMNRSI